MLQLYAKTRAKRRSRVSEGIYWILAGLLFAFAGWLWWRSGQVTISPAKPPTAVVPAPPAVRTNLSAKDTSATNQAPLPRVVVTNPVTPVTVVSNTPPTESSLLPPRVQEILAAQIAMAECGVSCGSLDGVLGSQTRAALRRWQDLEHLSPTGKLDDASRSKLCSAALALTNYTVTSADLERLHPLSRTWLGKSQQSRLDYETILELVAEKGHAHPELIRRLNPNLPSWRHVPAGTVIKIPAVEYPIPHGHAAMVKIKLAEKVLEVFDAQHRLMAHFPCSIAQKVEKRPVGQLRVTTIVPNPNYVFKPELFPESEEGQRLGRRLVLPPGPNNPVGTTWIGLDRNGYGIHGTPRPEEVGRTESHGCFRLANWNADYLAQLVEVGTPVLIEP